MKKLLCPQCKITRFNVKNDSGDAIVVIVDENYEIIPINFDQSLDGYNLDIVYCLGCSWKGSPKSLRNK